MADKTNLGNFFEDFSVGQELPHATPRTVTDGDVALYTALYGPRFALQSSREFARRIGFPTAPVDDLLVFHLVFGKTVPDVSLNAVANLGYAGGRFFRPVYPGDSLSAQSTVIGVKENANKKTGIVYLRTEGHNQHGQPILTYNRWVMIKKRDPKAAAPKPVIPELPGPVTATEVTIVQDLHLSAYDTRQSGSVHLWEDYTPGERIDHVDGMTVEEADHMLATRLYQNTAKVHFNQFEQKDGHFGRRLVYGGHVISLARALSFNGVANGLMIVAINGGTHANPVFAGDTVFAWSEVLGKEEIPDRTDMGLLRLRTVATKDQAATRFPYQDEAGRYVSSVVLDFDYTVIMPRRVAP